MQAQRPSSTRKAITKTIPLTAQMLRVRLLSVARDAGLETSEVNLYASIGGRSFLPTTDNLEVDDDGTLTLELPEEVNHGE